MLRVTELFDLKVGVLEGGIAQSEAELESWGDIFLVRGISNGHDTGSARPLTYSIEPTIVDEEPKYSQLVSKI